VGEGEGEGKIDWHYLHLFRRLPREDKDNLFDSMIFVLVIFLSSILATSAAAQSGKNFFEGKTITLFAGSSAGGGTDITARLIARHMERHIPGIPESSWPTSRARAG
jgi:hypothetical protein